MITIISRCSTSPANSYPVLNNYADTIKLCIWTMTMDVDPRYLYLLYKQGDFKNCNLNCQWSWILKLVVTFSALSHWVYLFSCDKPIFSDLRSRVEAVHVHTARVSLLLKHELLNWKPEPVGKCLNKLVIIKGVNRCAKLYDVNIYTHT